MINRLNVFLILVLFLSFCTKNEAVENSEAAVFFPGMEIRDSLYYENGAVEPYSGSRTSSYSNEKPYVSASFEEGRLNGTYTAWYSNGQKMGISHYEDGIQHGRSVAWHDNGVLASTVNFVDNKKEGVLNTYYTTGQQRMEVFFSQDQYDSTLTRWDMQGNIQSVELYRDGKFIRDMGPGKDMR